MRRLYSSIALVLVFCACLRADNIVANVSTAAPDYLSLHKSASEPTRQSFVLLQGRFFPGRIRDRGLEKTPFITVARVVGRALQEKETSPTFYPARSLASADLLIVVHWGVSTGRDRNYELERQTYEKINQLTHEQAAFEVAADAAAEETGVARLPLDNPFSAALGHELDFRALENASREINDAARGQSIATLLGFSKDLRKNQHAGIASEHTRSLLDLLEEDRYFILVFAYDMKRLREESRLVVSWTTRLSIRSAGVDFGTAVSRLSKAGSGTFGTEPGSVKFETVKTQNRVEEIHIGEAIIIETLP